LKPPGPAYFHHSSLRSMRLIMLSVQGTRGKHQYARMKGGGGAAEEGRGAYLSQWAEMSPVVRQLLPTSGAQVAGLSTPHSHLQPAITSRETIEFFFF
jgi:hypothetical protein